MNFNNHSNLEGQHAFLGASKYHWINYSEDKVADAYSKFLATQKGTVLHAFAAQCISLGQKLPKSQKTLNMYVNDAIGYKMTPEQTLFYSENCFGTADSISYRSGLLRIHDLKTGVIPAHMEQLMIYAALFCLEYKVKPADIDMELRIYQNNEVLYHNPTAEDIVPISTVISKVHKSPMSRIRTTQADIRNIDTLKAHGYKKGKQKKLAGNFNLVRRTTDPQTIYVKNALNRDDIVDITDFDYVAYLYSIDRMNLNEELAKAIMIGDGRDDGAEDKIFPEHIRPIWLDDDLYTIHTDLDITSMKAELQGTNTGANFGDNYVYAEAMVQTLLYAREDYKGTGTPDLYCTPHMANVMLLARDLNGRRIYSSKAELATALNVSSINTAEQFANKTRKTSDGKTKKLIALIVNLQDYSLGATKGGEITHFTQFDIDFNQEKSLLETRCSGALTRVYSAIAIEEDVTDTKGQQTGDLAG